MMKDPNELFEGWLSGSLSEEEINRLMEGIGEKDGPWPSLIDQLIQDPGFSGMGKPEQRERLFRQLMEEAKEKKNRKLIYSPIFRWAAAAMFILLAGGGYWWYGIQKTDFTPVAVAGQAPIPDLLPGTNKAMLTLSNGSKILLDSAQKGQLARQSGALIVKSDNGQIAYEADKPGLPAKTTAISSPVPVYNTLTTPRGGQYKLVLPDGTGVWLNASSSITYPTAFTGKERNVSITGEAYFEVAKINAMPFRVQTKQMDVTVLGTHFDISAYEDDPSVNTTLIEGSVKVGKGNKQELLKPGQQAQIKESGSINVLAAADMDAVLAWKNGFFSFNHTDLPTVMRQIARWYDVTIEYQGKIPDMKFGGSIPRSAKASEVLTILEESKIHCRIEGKKIIVTP